MVTHWLVTLVVVFFVITTSPSGELLAIANAHQSPVTDVQWLPWSGEKTSYSPLLNSTIVDLFLQM